MSTDLAVPHQPPLAIGLLLHRFRGAFCSSALIVSATVAAFSPKWASEDSWFAWETDALAWCCFFAGALFRFWATLYVGGRKSQEVVCDGPYSITRNPIYVGSFLILLSAVLFLESVVFAFGALIPMLTYVLGTVPFEEAKLANRLGRPYLEYCQRTPRFLPRFGLFRSKRIVPVHLKGLRTEFLRALVWLFIPLVTQLLAHLRELPGWPILFRLP